MTPVPARRRTRTLAVAVAVATVTATATAPDAAATPATPATACTSTWVAPADGEWSDPANWQPARTPRPADFVCILPSRGTPRIGLAGSVTVDQLRVGNAVVAVPAGAVLTARRVTFTLSGGLDGPGGVEVTGSSARLGVTAGATTSLTRGAQLVSTGFLYLDGDVRLSGGSQVTAYITFASDGSSVTDDGSAGNGFTTSSYVGHGTVALQVTSQFDSLVVADGVTAVPRLVGARADGTTLLPSTHVYPGADLLVPYPIVRLRTRPGNSAVVEGRLLVAATGRPALADLEQITGVIRLGDVVTAPRGLRVGDGAGRTATLDLAGVLTVPAVDVGAGSTVQLDDAGQVRGDLRLCDDTTARCVVSAEGGSVDGDVAQNNGIADCSPGSRTTGVTGSWTAAADARTQLSSYSYRGAGVIPPCLDIAGTATFGGYLGVSLTGYGTPPVVGTRTTVLVAHGGLTANFRRIDASPGWTVSTTRTSIIATYRG